MTPFRHALIVGGSGMLAACCRRLAAHCGSLSVMARDAARIGAIGLAIHPLACDYNDSAAVAAMLAADRGAHGAPDLLLAWIHGKAPALRRRLAEAVAPAGRFVQVLGSAHGDPSRPDRLAAMADAAAGLPVAYQAVVLGFAVEAGRSRWLTQDEISDGVFAAVESGAARATVGTLEPWSARP